MYSYLQTSNQSQDTKQRSEIYRREEEKSEWLLYDGNGIYLKCCIICHFVTLLEGLDMYMHKKEFGNLLMLLLVKKDEMYSRTVFQTQILIDTLYVMHYQAQSHLQV